MKDKSKLHRKVITNKQGHRQTVWVRGQKESDNKSFKQYTEALGDLKSAIKDKKFHNDDMAKLYYQNALKMGLKENFYDNKTRLALNRHNKKLGIKGLGGGDAYRDHLIAGVDIVLGHFKGTKDEREKWAKSKLSPESHAKAILNNPKATAKEVEGLKSKISSRLKRLEKTPLGRKTQDEVYRLKELKGDIDHAMAYGVKSLIQQKKQSNGK